MEKIKVLIADDHAIVRIGLRSVFGYEPDIEVVAEAKNGIEAVREAERTHPDVAVVDLVMPRKDGVAATREILAAVPSVKVLILTTFGTSDGIAHALEAGASGGEIPDVFWMHSNTAQMYMENEILLDLDDYIAADDSINLDDYYPGITELYSSGGKQYALPKDHDTIALLYNQEIFDRYNVEAPTDDWSWDDVYEAAAKITEAGKADGIYGYAADTSNDQDFWYNLVYGYGGFIVDTDHKTVGIASDASKAGMEMVRKIISVSTPQTIVTETGTDSLFQSNLCAMITQGSWMINAFYTAEGAANYKWVEIPYSDANGNGTCDDGERVSCYNGLGWAAAANTDNPDAAYSLISYFCSKEGQTKQAELGITMAGMPGVSDAFAGAFEGMDVSAFIKVEENGTLFFRPYSRNSIAWSQPITQAGALLDAWQNPTDPAAMSTACDNAARIMEQAIANE
jgi:multiple sugar transport system substrate-binding protein